MKLWQWLKSLFKKSYKLHVYADVGVGEVVVLLHGIAADGSVWSELIDDLSHQYRVVVIDLLGFGQSPKPQDSKYSAYDHAIAVYRTVKQLGIKKYYLVGHSMGAIVALKLSSEKPKTIVGLMCVAMPSYDMSDGRKKALIRYRTNTYVRIYNAMIQHPDLTWAATQALILGFGPKIGLKLDKPSVVPFQRSLANTIIKQQSLVDLSKIKVPTVVIYGNLDPFIVQEYYSIKYIENPYVKFIRVRASHALDKALAATVKEQIFNLNN